MRRETIRLRKDKRDFLQDNLADVQNREGSSSDRIIANRNNNCPRKPKKRSGKTVIHARVSSHEQKEDLKRQIQRLRDFCAKRGLIITQEIAEIGSALKGKRKKMLKMLTDNSITTIVVEHRDRLTRFGFDYIEAALRTSNRNIIVINEMECNDDLV